jgi:hypothetical protein
MSRAARATLLLVLVALGCTSPAPNETASPTNGQQPTPSVSQPATSPTPATTTPEPTQMPTPTPLGELETILTHVPSKLSCGALEWGPADQASVSCSSTDGLAVTYALYPATEQMRRAYADIFGRAEIDADSGNCARAETWPAEGHYSLPDGTVGGRFLCLVRGGRPMVYWTIDDAAILAVAGRSDNDPARLWHFWLYDSEP